MINALHAVVVADPRVAYALIFGSHARGTVHAHSDVDVAIGVLQEHHFDSLALGRLTANLEAAVGKPVDLVLLDEAPPGLAYRIFRDARPILIRDERAMNVRRARAILEYLDFRPIEELCARGVLAAGDG